MFCLCPAEILAEEEGKCSLPRQLSVKEKHEIKDKRNFLAKRNCPPTSVKSLPPKGSARFMCSTPNFLLKEAVIQRPSKRESLSSEKIA